MHRNAQRWTLRPARRDDAAAIAAIWHEGWPDGHLGHVPPDLVECRREEDFHRLVESRMGATTVAVTGRAVVGFVTVIGDEIEQLYVSRPARGTGAAAALLRYGEDMIADASDVAWLAVVAGNGRARRFYERLGWANTGPFDNPADIGGGTIAVPALRYEKRLHDAIDAKGAA